MSSLTSLLDSALSARQSLVDDGHLSAYRLFNGFLEGFPTMSLDIYAHTALIHDYGMDPNDNQLPEVQAWILEKLPWVNCILAKSRGSQNTPQTRGSLLYGSAPDQKILENGVWYALDLSMNRDASFYLDTRNLRTWAKTNLAGKSLLNTFAYTGSLGVAALAGGATRVVQLDRSAKFLDLARQSGALNGLRVSPSDLLAQDFFTAVGHLKHNQQTFDCVFLDPPFFASSTKGTVDLETGSTRLINKVRPLIKHGGWLVAINNALFVSGRDYMESLKALCAGDYLSLEELIPVPPDFTGFPQTVSGHPPCDPAPFNHSTKIAVLRVSRKGMPAG